ncbi:NOT3 [Candida oxycetoniae]|uniref:NOT3 n=1 Tax=Candida oxycetoniae TaxID=497107 RepID=A0AAI9SVZ2_9ASCO|nr:NOT3 [Candida oxycetoniae]KAI3403734.2 NOT3 [Candida oxycetoniae]
MRANDLKKEIKKLQKFREQIKHWLSNDAVNTLGPVGTSYMGKLLENKSVIEDAMETYKSVEKQTKLKTFSNQSIMMTFIDSAHGDEDDEDSEEIESSEEEDESEYEGLSEEAVDSIKFFKDAISELKEQTEKSTHEHEKLAGKKLRKNNLSTIEAKKEKIQATIANNKFHQKKLRKLIKLLKNGSVIEFNLIFALKGDIEQYLNTNGDYDFGKDTELYEDIFNQIAAAEEDYSEIHEDHSTEPTSEEGNNEYSATKKNGYISENFAAAAAATTTTTVASSSTSHPTNSQAHEHNNTSAAANHSTTQPVLSSSGPQQAHHHLSKNSYSSPPTQNNQAPAVAAAAATTSTPTTTTTSSLSSQNHSHTLHGQQNSGSQTSPEIASPAIVRSLKPATTPSKPVGGLKWSAAAAVGIPDTLYKSSSTEYEDEGLQKGNVAVESPNNRAAAEEEQQEEAVKEEEKEEEENVQFDPIKLEPIDLDKYKNIIANSSLSKTELNLFADMNLVRVPPGIQDLAVSFASKRNNDEFKILVDSQDFNQYTCPIYKSYLPKIVQPNYYSQFTNFSFKHPIQLTKFQSHWNKIRAYYGFGGLVKEIKDLLLRETPENAALIAELTFVFFYGFYYGLTPAENLIAESSLFELGWKPYRTQLDVPTTINNSVSRAASTDGMNKENHSSQYFYWFRRLKLISSSSDQQQPLDKTQAFEIGDYQVFDLNFWEIFVKYGFKLDYSSCQLEPSKTLF